MDTRTGEIIDEKEFKSLPPEERKHFIPVTRDLSDLEKLNKQIMLYEPCGCGSGLKFKFCCNGKTTK